MSATTLITKTMVDPFLKEPVSRASNFPKGFPSDSLSARWAATTSIETERLRFVSSGGTFAL